MCGGGWSIRRTERDNRRVVAFVPSLCDGKLSTAPVRKLEIGAATWSLQEEGAPFWDGLVSLLLQVQSQSRYARSATQG